MSPQPQCPYNFMSSNNSSSPLLAGGLPPLRPSTTPSLGVVRRWQICQIWPPLPAVPIDAANQPPSTPPNCLRTTHVLTAFPTVTGTKQPEDANRSIGGTYCVRTAVDGPYAASGIIACNCIAVVNASCT